MTDACPACLRRGIPPAATARRGDRIVHGYRCPDCGHQWATTRLLSAYVHPRRQTTALEAAAHRRALEAALDEIDGRGTRRPERHLRPVPDRPARKAS
jgi:hypothetical protein